MNRWSEPNQLSHLKKYDWYFLPNTVGRSSIASACFVYCSPRMEVVQLYLKERNWKRILAAVIFRLELYSYVFDGFFEKTLALLFIWTFIFDSCFEHLTLMIDVSCVLSGKRLMSAWGLNYHHRLQSRRSPLVCLIQEMFGWELTSKFYFMSDWAGKWRKSPSTYDCNHIKHKWISTYQFS